MKPYITDFYNGNIRTGGILILIGFLFLLFFCVPWFVDVPVYLIHMQNSNLAISLLGILGGVFIVYKCHQLKSSIKRNGFHSAIESQWWQACIDLLKENGRILAWILSISVIVALASVLSGMGKKIGAILTPIILFTGILYCIFLLSIFRIEDYLRSIRKS